MFGRAPQPRIYIQKVYSVVNAVYTVVVLNVWIEVALDEVYQTVSLALSQFYGHSVHPLYNILPSPQVGMPVAFHDPPTPHRTQP